MDFYKFYLKFIYAVFGNSEKSLSIKATFQEQITNNQQ